MKCEYGCGNEAKFPPRKGMKKWCCENTYKKCPKISKRRNDEDINKFLNEKGYIWISGKYENEMSFLKLKCKNGHEYTTNYNNLNTGGSCPECSGITYWTLDKVKEILKKRGYECLSAKYTYIEKMKFKCIFGHIFHMRFDILNGGSECPECQNILRSVRLSGNGNPNWKGGIQNKPYCEIWSNLEFKESIKFRDDYKCLNPHCSNKSDILVIHHIDYNKDNCDNNNLITLCNSCNVKANYDRDWHTSWYKALLYQRYKI